LELRYSAFFLVLAKEFHGGYGWMDGWIGMWILAWGFYVIRLIACSDIRLAMEKGAGIDGGGKAL
jgi:hypothetical protein